MIRKFEIFILVALLIVIGVFTINWALRGAIHYQKDITIPDLTQKSLTEALEIISQQNLGIKKEGVEFNDKVPAGTILRQQPTGGSLVREGKIIRLTLSQGNESVYVPDLAGRSLKAAEVALRTNFLSLGEVKSQPSVRYEKDLVISQNPPARKIVARNSYIHLIISAGPPEDGTILLPDFEQKNWSDVLSWAKPIGVKVTMNPDDTSPLPRETVLQQETAPDTPINKEMLLEFTVSSGKAVGVSSGSVNSSAIKFRYEIPQSESAKKYQLILIDSIGARELYSGEPQPGSKLEVTLPAKIGASPRIRIMVNGMLTDERVIQ